LKISREEDDLYKETLNLEGVKSVGAKKTNYIHTLLVKNNEETSTDENE